MLEAMLVTKPAPQLRLQEIESGVIGFILDTKYAGIIRQAGQEPWEGELLFMVSRYGASNTADIHNLPGSASLLTIEKCKLLEPGSAKYYIICLPKMAESRALGPTSIAPYHLLHARAFDILDTALEAFENAGPKQD